MLLARCAGRRPDFLVAYDDLRGGEGPLGGENSGRGSGDGFGGDCPCDRVAWRVAGASGEAQAGQIRGVPADARGEQQQLQRMQ